MRCFVHFYFKMRFSPQRRAIFRHQNFKKWSKHAVFCTFLLQNVLFATAACNFWFLLWAPTSAPAALTGLLLDWPDTRIIEKTQHFATSLTFGADVSSFFWLSRYCIFFQDLTTLLCFSTVHIVGSFYFKRPSITRKWMIDPVFVAKCCSFFVSSHIPKLDLYNGGTLRRYWGGLNPSHWAFVEERLNEGMIYGNSLLGVVYVRFKQSLCFTHDTLPYLAT